MPDENNLSDISTILALAERATNSQKWALVNHYLQQLPEKKHGAGLLALEESQWEKILEIALQVLRQSDFNQRWEVARVFPKLGNQAIAALLAIVENENESTELRWFSARICSEFKEPEVILSLVKLWQNTEEEELAAIAAKSLANIGSLAIRNLNELLSQDSSRLLAVQALAHIRHPETIEPLLRVVEDNNPLIRATAIEALGSFQQTRIIPVLIKALKDLVANVRKEAVIALGMRSDIEEKELLVEQLQPLLYDFNGDVCNQTAIALGRIGTKDAIASLYNVLKSPLTPYPLQVQLVRSLIWQEQELGLDYLQQSLTWGSYQLCQEIITILGRNLSSSLKPKAAAILCDFYHQRPDIIAQTPTIKQALANSLGSVGSSIAVDILEKLSRDRETSVRLHAIAALKKVV